MYLNLPAICFQSEWLQQKGNMWNLANHNAGFKMPMGNCVAWAQWLTSYIDWTVNLLPESTILKSMQQWYVRAIIWICGIKGLDTYVNSSWNTYMVNKEFVTSLSLSKSSNLSFCEGYVESKMCRNPFKLVGVRSTRKLQLVHSNMCGPMPTESLGGHKYFVKFTDDYSRHCFVYFMKHPFEVLSKFKEFEAITTTECDLKIRALRTGSGSEYISIELKEYLKHRGIRHELTVPYNPEQNAVAERLNRTLMEAAQSVISHAGLTSNYWGKAVATAAYVYNRAAATATNRTPYEGGTARTWSESEGLWMHFLCTCARCN